MSETNIMRNGVGGIAEKRWDPTDIRSGKRRTRYHVATDGHQLTSSKGMFELLKEDRARRWSRPPSWWSLFALAPFLLFLGASVHSWWRDAQTAKRQQTAFGTIDRHDPPNHNRYGYTFLVNGRQFTGWSSPTEKHDFVVGQQIVVYYDPLDPTENSAYDFNDVNPGGVFLIGFLVLACVVYPFSIYFQRHSRKNAEVA